MMGWILGALVIFVFVGFIALESRQHRVARLEKPHVTAAQFCFAKGMVAFKLARKDWYCVDKKDLPVTRQKLLTIKKIPVPLDVEQGP